MHFVYEVRSKKSERLSRTSKLWSYINDGETLIQSLKRTLFNSIFPSGSSCFLRIKKHCFFNPFFFLSLVEDVCLSYSMVKANIEKSSILQRFTSNRFSVSLFSLSLSLSLCIYLTFYPSIRPTKLSLIL